MLSLVKNLFHSKPPSQIDITDDFIKWLCFANAGMLDRGNLYLIDYAMSRLPSDSPILEIGSFCGLSTNVLLHYRRKHQRTNPVFTCDKWEFENGDNDKQNVGGSHLSFAEYKQFVRDSFIRNVRTFSDDLPFSIELLSTEFFELWRERRSIQDVFCRTCTLGGPLSFCYIDGNHSYEGVKEDFENCDQFLEPGGFILFDDSNVRDFGVWRLIAKIEAEGRYQLAGRNPNHLFQKRY